MQKYGYMYGDFEVEDEGPVATAILTRFDGVKVRMAGYVVAIMAEFLRGCGGPAINTDQGGYASIKFLKG